MITGEDHRKRKMMVLCCEESIVSSSEVAMLVLRYGKASCFVSSEGAVPSKEEAIQHIANRDTKAVST